MIRFSLLFLLAVSMFGGVTRSPSADGGSTCLGRPCTYTVTGTAGIGSCSDVQTAVDDAQRGDMILLEAGTNFRHNTAGAVCVAFDKTPSGSSGYVTITSTEHAKLPPDGTRITPVYWPLIPFFEMQNTSPLTSGTRPNPVLYFYAATEGRSTRTPGVAAKYYKVKGVGFWTDTENDFSSALGSFIQVGHQGGGYANTSGTGTLLGSFSSLTVTGEVATATVNAASSRKTGDTWRLGGLTGAAASLNGPVTFLSTSSTVLTFAAPGLANGDYTQATMYLVGPGYANQMPDDIVFDQLVMLQGGLTSLNRGLYINGQNITVKNSYISCARGTFNTDTQSILVTNGVGNYTIENNYLGGPTTEHFHAGGGSHSLESQVDGLLFRYNYFTHSPIEGRRRTWTVLKADADPLIVRGRVVRPTVDTGRHYIATNDGQLGTTEPTWCTTTRCTVTDGTVTWMLFTSGTTQVWNVKNLFELKDAKNVTLRHNVFAKKWWSDQIRTIVIKAENQSLYPDFQGSCAPTFLGTAGVTNGSAVVTAATGTFPWQVNTSGVTATAMKLGGVAYTISSFDSATQLTLTTTYTGSTGTVEFIYGNDPSTRFCQAGSTMHTTIEHNVVRDTAAPLVITTGTNVHRSLVDGYYVRNNLIENVDPLTWSGAGGNAYHATLTTPIFTNPIVSNAVFDHNTFHTPSSAATYGIYGDSDATEWPGDTIFRNNIWTKHLTGISRSSSTQHQQLFCGNLGDCPASQWNKNLFVGHSLTGYTTWPGAIYNHCATTGSCTPDYTTLFQDYANYNFRLRGTGRDGTRATSFARTSTTGDDIGADISMLPRIEGLKVTPTDRMVLFTYAVSRPISEYNCAIEVSTHPAFNKAYYVAELASIGTYYGKDLDYADMFPRNGRKRTIVVGHTVPLSASTTYYYRLQCGGDTRDGSFVTEATKSSTGSFGVSEAGAAAMTWGYSYSRATDTISGGGSGTCVSSTCTASGITKGRVFWYRIGTGPVKSTVIQ